MPESMTDREKVAKYEELLEQVLNEKLKREGKILAGPSYGYYRVQVGDGEIIAKSPSFRAKVNQSVIVVEGTIVDALPDGLISVEEEVVEFQKIKWSDIGGMKSQIDDIKRKIEYPVIHRQLYKEFGLRPSSGIILYGPPGCGKTMIAKAVASVLLPGSVTKQSFTYVKGGELLSKFVGESEQHIKRIFESARLSYKKTGVRPIVFIDEAEAILPPRGSRVSSDVDTTIVPTFLSEMDGFEGNNPFMILATNYLNRIDEAIIRPGRIDLKVYVGRPTQDDCEEIFGIHLGKTRVVGNTMKLAREASAYLFSIDRLVEVVSGALIENIVAQSIENAIIRKINDKRVDSGVTFEDIMLSVNNQ